MKEIWTLPTHSGKNPPWQFLTVCTTCLDIFEHTVFFWLQWVWRKTLTGKVRKLGTIWTDWAIGVPIDVAYDVYDVDDGDDGDDDDDDDDDDADADADAVDDDDGDDGDDGGAYSKSATRDGNRELWWMGEPS